MPGATRGAVLSSLSDTLVQQAWRALIERPLSVERAFGAPGESVKLTLDQAVKTHYSQSLVQDEFQAAKEKDGFAVAWLATGGTIGGELKAATKSNALSGEVAFTLERPFVYKPNAPDVGRLGEELLRNHSTGLPFTVEKARALEPGSKLTLRGHLSGVVGEGDSLGDPRVRGKVSAEQRLTWLAKDKVEAELIIAGDVSANATQARTDGKGSVSLRGGAEKSRSVKVTIDLSTQRGANAFAALMRFQPEALVHLAKGGDGVKLEHDQTPDAVSIGGSGWREGAAGRISADASAENATLADGTVRKRRTAEVTLTPALGDHASGELVLRGSKLTHEHPDGRRVFSGSVYRKVAGSAEHSRQDREIAGHHASGRQWSLELPPTSTGPVELPMSSALAQKLPAGAKFDLTLDSNAGLTIDGSQGTSATGRVEADANKRTDRSVNLWTQRGEGDLIKVRLSARTEVNQGQSGKLAKAEAGRDVSLSAERGVRWVTSETGAIDLDLSKAEDQAIYDELVRGELSGLAKRAPLEVEKFKSSSSSIELAVAPNPYLSAGLQLTSETFDANDWRARNSDARRAVMDQAKASGKKVEWRNEAGVAELSLKTPTVSMGTTGAGFSAGKTFQYSVERPVVDGVVQGSRWPPMDVEDALKMPAGSRVRLESVNKGEVNLALAAGGVGAKVELGAGVKGERSATVSAEFAGDGTVSVSIDDDSNSKLTYLKFLAEAGVVVPYETATSLASKLFTKLSGVDALADPRLRLEVEASRSGRERSQLEVKLDLKQPAHAEAYRELMRGNPAPAIRLNKGTAVYDKESRDRLAVGLDGFGVAVRAEKTRESEVRLTATDGTVAATNTERASKRSTFFDQRRSVTFEAVSKHQLGALGSQDLAALAQTSGGELDDTYFRLTGSTTEAFTSAQRVNHTKAMAAGMGLVPDGEQRAEEAKDRGLSAVLGSLNRFGKTDSSLDVMVSRRGVERFRQQPAEAAEAAFGSFFTLATGRTPTWAGPQAAKAKEFLDAYLIEGGEYRGWAEGQYYSTFKRRLVDDLEEYQHLRSFKRFHERMQQSPDAREWSRAFADHGAEMGEESFASIYAFNQLAGADSVMVNQLTMSGRAVRLKYQPRNQSTPHAQLPAPSAPPAVVTQPAVAAPVAPQRPAVRPPPAPLDLSGLSSAAAVRRAAALRAAEVVIHSLEARLAAGALDAESAVSAAASLASLGPLEQLDEPLRSRAESIRQAVGSQT